MNSRVRGNLAVRVWVLLILATAFVAPARADQPSAYGPELEGFGVSVHARAVQFPLTGPDCIHDLHGRGTQQAQQK